MDLIAKRRGKWAHEVLSLDAEQVTYELICLEAAGRHVESKIRAINSAKGMVFPVIDLTEG